MWEYANGIDNTEVQYKKEKPKSLGNSITLPMDISNIEKLKEVIVALTEQVAYRLRKEEMLAKVVNVQLRTNKFEDFSHQMRLSNATSNTKEILAKAKELLTEMYKEGMSIRLIGVRVDNLVSKDEVQLSLFDNSNKKNEQDKLDNVIDKLKEKYGYNSIMRAGKLNVNEIIKINSRNLKEK